MKWKSGIVITPCSLLTPSLWSLYYHRAIWSYHRANGY